MDYDILIEQLRAIVDMLTRENNNTLEILRGQLINEYIDTCGYTSKVVDIAAMLVCLAQDRITNNE
jgi:hypothetical protein